jgi:hypothetical protein
LEETLERRYGEGSVFLDSGDIDIGTHFPDRIAKEIGQADVVLCLVGSRWRGPGEEWRGKARIHRPDDWVRIEVDAAMKGRPKVVPILLDGAKMPTPRELPPTLKRFPDLNGHQMSLATWKADLAKLFQYLDDLKLQRDTKKLPGGEILRRHQAGEEAPTWVGRVHGRSGAMFQQDVETGRWRDQPYEVQFGGSPRSNNWFLVSEFAADVAGVGDPSSSAPGRTPAEE